MGDADIRRLIARRAAQEVQSGMVVNLGIGIPSLVPDFLDKEIQVMFQAENGILGMGPSPISNADPNLSNAAGYPVTVVPGASYFDSAISFGMIRTGRVDLAILGALQVSESGDLANWIVPGKRVPGVGGAMELAAGARRLIAVMSHTEKDGSPKIVSDLTLPVTAKSCVSKIITEMAVFSVTPDGLMLEELLGGCSEADVRKCTGAAYHISESLVS